MGMGPAIYTGYYIGNEGYIIGPDPQHSAKFSIRDKYIVGPTKNSGRYYLGDPVTPDGPRYVYGPVGPIPATSLTGYYATKDGHFYGPNQRLPWFD